MNDEIPEEIAADLPPPSSDEPTSLRRDIIDELADHLTCSVQREQFREGAAGHSETQIWKRVLERFGSPSDVARRLWIDWMWEKIVMQRVTMFLMIAMVVCTIAMFVTMNQALQASRESQTMLMKEILAIKESQPTTAAPLQPTEWNNLKIKVVYDDEFKTPVEGVNVTVIGDTDQTKMIPDVRQVTDSTGEVDCGMVLYGEYNVDVQLTKGAVKMIVRGNRAIVHPNQDGFLEVVIPETLEREVKFHLDFEDADQAIEFDTSRIWCLNKQLSQSPTTRLREDGATVSWLSVSTETKGPLEGVFITTHGVIESTSLERIDPQERFDGLLDAMDERIHRFSGDRMLIPEGVLLKDSVPLGYGKYTCQSYNIDLYLEMRLNDGRRILTKIPDLYAPRFFSPNTTFPDTLYKSEFQSFQKMAMQNLDWNYYSNPFSGKPKKEVGFLSGEVQYFSPRGRGIGKALKAPATRIPISDFFINYRTGGQTLARTHDFSVFSHSGEGTKEALNEQILPSQQSLATLNFLASIPADFLLVSAVLSMSNDIPGWRVQKFDLFLSGRGIKDETIVAQGIQIFATLPGSERGATNREGMSEAYCLIGIPEQEFVTAHQNLTKRTGEDAQEARLYLMTAKPSRVSKAKPEATEDPDESTGNDN